MATVGFYLWLQFAQLLADIAYFLITHYGQTDPGTVNAALTLARYVVIAAGVVMVFNALQFNAATVAAIAGGASAGLAFASSEILNNFIGGIILLFERSIRPGDVLKVESGGGGGWGPPRQRTAAARAADVANGFVAPGRNGKREINTSARKSRPARGR